MANDNQKNTQSPGDELEEMLRKYRAEKASQPSNQESEAQENSDTASESSKVPSTDFSSHFGDASEEENTQDSIPSHFSECDEAVPSVEASQSSSEKDTEEDEFAGAPKVLRFFLKIGKAFLHLSFLAKALIYSAVVLIVSAYLAYFIITVVNDVFALVTDDNDVIVTIPEGADEDYVVNLLKEDGLIEYDWAFRIYLQHNADGEEITFIPGDHTLNTSMNYSQMVYRLTVETVTREIVTITFPEGFTVDEIIDTFLANGIGTREGFVDAINNYPYKHEFVQLLTSSGWDQDRKYRLEGYLFPDTYEFYTDTEEYLAINKMLNNFNDRIWVDWKATYAEICEQDGLSLDDIVTLASMVEAEGKTAEDFEYISYVFHNRLSHSSSFPYLESDATIQYALELDGLERIQDSSEIDISYESPYNTYTNQGLPPGAIGNPGLDAILATIYPSAPLDENDEEINAYYFVSNNAGKTYYAATLSQHKKNVAQVEKENEASKKE